MKGHISVYTNNIDEKQSEMLKYFEKVETDEGNHENVHSKGGLERSLGTRIFGFA